MSTFFVLVGSAANVDTEKAIVRAEDKTRVFKNLFFNEIPPKKMI
jgi:hypothetical protein